MNKPTERHRVAGVIVSVEEPHVEDHGCLTTWVNVSCGFHQGFGGIAFANRKEADDWVNELCVAVFGVAQMEQLVGKAVYVLYSFGEHNETIEGLESVDTGHRFLMNAWRKKHYPETKNLLVQRSERLQARIEQLERQLYEAKHDLKQVAQLFYDWEKV